MVQRVLFVGMSLLTLACDMTDFKYIVTRFICLTRKNIRHFMKH